MLCNDSAKVSNTFKSGDGGSASFRNVILSTQIDWNLFKDLSISIFDLISGVDDSGNGIRCSNGSYDDSNGGRESSD